MHSLCIHVLAQAAVNQSQPCPDLQSLDILCINRHPVFGLAHDGMPYGSIRIRSRSAENNGGVNISIADSGSGMAPENLVKIFDPFFTTKPVGKGTGLGLSICFSIIQRLGGNINVESEIGKGTEFSLFLPLEPPLALKESIKEKSEN